MEGTFQEIIKEIWLFMPRVAVSLFVFLSFCIAGVIIQKLIIKFISKTELNQEVQNLTGRIVKSGFVIFGAVTALGTVGVNVSALVAGLGLTGFAIGFALKDALSNLLAGILIIIYRPFQIKDRILVGGYEGVVININLRYTTLQGEDKKILIPNSNLFTNTITVMEIK